MSRIDFLASMNIFVWSPIPGLPERKCARERKEKIAERERESARIRLNMSSFLICHVFNVYT